jgi:hypothetical protein
MINKLYRVENLLTKVSPVNTTGSSSSLPVT